MATPIVKVYNASGTLSHDCEAAGCAVSWDGYVLAEGYGISEPDPNNPGQTIDTKLAVGDRVPGATDPDARWDVSEPGVARLQPEPG